MSLEAYLPRLFGGATMGIGMVVSGMTGWSLGGYCPGPAMVTALPAADSSFVFVIAMLVRMGLHHLIERYRAEARTTPVGNP